MQLEQQFTVQATRARTWEAFQDAELLVGCLPGASLTGPATPQDVPLRFDVKLGPMTAGFAGRGQIQFNDTRYTGTFAGTAIDARSQSRVKGSAAFSLHEGGAADTCEVRVAVDYTLTGALAQFGRPGIVRDIAQALTTQFAKNLEQRLQGGLDADKSGLASSSDARDASSTVPQKGAASTLSLWSLLRAVIAVRLRRLGAWFRGGSAA